MKAHPTRSRPRSLVRSWPAMVLIQPKASSIRLRMRQGVAHMPRRAAVDRRRAAICVLRHVKRRVHRARLVDEILGVVRLVGVSVIALGPSARGSIICSAAIRSAWPLASVRQASTMRPLRFSIGAYPEAELGFLAWSFAIEPSLRIGRRGMRLVGALLAMKVRLAIAPDARSRGLAAIPWPKALHRRPRFDQRAVDGDVLRAEQAFNPRLRQNRAQELGAPSGRREPCKSIARGSFSGGIDGRPSWA